MFRNYILLFIPLFLGYLLKQIKSLPKITASVLYFFVINIALPATILVSIRNIALSYDLLIPAAAQWVSLITAAGIVMAVSAMFKFNRLITGTLLLVVPMGNTAFLGLNVIPVFFDRTAVSYGIMYDQLGSFLALATYGAAVAGIYGQTERVKIVSLIKNIVTFPPLIFLVIGLLLMNYSLPEPVNKLLSLLSKTLVPVAMVSIGLNLSLAVGRQSFTPLVLSLLIRLILAPVIILVLFIILGLTGIAAQIAVFQAAMPSMVMAAVLASDKGLDKPLATSIVSIGLIVSLATLPLIYYLIELFLAR